MSLSRQVPVSLDWRFLGTEIVEAADVTLFFCASVWPLGSSAVSLCTLSCSPFLVRVCCRPLLTSASYVSLCGTAVRTARGTGSVVKAYLGVTVPGAGPVPVAMVQPSRASRCGAAWVRRGRQERVVGARRCDARPEAPVTASPSAAVAPKTPTHARPGGRCRAWGFREATLS